jgi:hypothetical protein
VTILPSNFTNSVAWTPFINGSPGILKNGQYTIHTNEEKAIGLGVSFADMVKAAYGSDSLATIIETELPAGRFDFIANLQTGALEALRDAIRDQYGITGTWNDVQTNALAMVLSNPEKQAFKPSNRIGTPINSLRITVQNIITKNKMIVVDATGLHGRYDWSFDCPRVPSSTPEGLQIIEQAIYDQLGVELIQTNIPVRTLIIEQAK